MTLRAIIVFVFFVLQSTMVVRADDQNITWNEAAPQFFVAKDQVWKSSFEDVHFDAIRVHLGYFSISLVDVSSYSQSNRSILNNVNDNRKFSSALLDVGVENILRSYPDSSTVAIVAAGWSATLKKVEQIGLLRIDGSDHFDFSDNPSMSAVVCLNSPAFDGKGYDYQIPTFFRLDIDWQLRSIDKCHDALQIGPRIVEDVGQGKSLAGIEDAERRLRPQIRTIMLVDAPIRNTLRNYKSRDNARNVYFIITRNPVHLISIQNMILNGFFLGFNNHPEWAINLVNGGPSGLAYRDSDQNTIFTFGNPSGIFGSAIAITRR